jgi:hypothetical protein
VKNKIHAFLLPFIFVISKLYIVTYMGYSFLDKSSYLSKSYNEL